MVQELYNEVEKLKAEVRRLRGEMNRMSIGGVIIPTSVSGASELPNPVEGAMIIGNATPDWRRLVRDVPGGAALRNIIGLDFGDTLPSWKAMFSAALPEPIIFGQSGAAGTSLLAAHLDHIHALDDIELYIPFGYEGGGQAYTP